MKNNTISFLSDFFFYFLKVKFSIYLNRRVFVMNAFYSVHKRATRAFRNINAFIKHILDMEIHKKAAKHGTKPPSKGTG